MCAQLPYSTAGPVMNIFNICVFEAGNIRIVVASLEDDERGLNGVFVCEQQ